MGYIEALFLGIIQGITEFLPISSTGHLWIAEYFFLGLEPSIALQVLFHFATVIAVILVFWKRIVSLFSSIFLFSSPENPDFIFSWKLITATVITGGIGIIAKPWVEHMISAPIVAGTLFITAFFILVSEYFSPSKTQFFSWNIAIILGVVQAIAIIPGISRSGATIVFLLLVGIAKKQALEISFLLSIPTILASFLFLIPDLTEQNLFTLPLLAGGIMAGITAYYTITVMMNHLQKIWKWFALWCVAVGGGVLIWG